MCKDSNGACPVVNSTRGETQNHLWQAKYNIREIHTENRFFNTINYIQNNRQKHELPENKKLSDIIFKMLCSYEDAFEQYEGGGFDVVIGNPPYVKEYTSKETFELIKKSSNAKYYQGKMDLWYFFLCYGLDVLKNDGKIANKIKGFWECQEIEGE